MKENRILVMLTSLKFTVVAGALRMPNMVALVAQTRGNTCEDQLILLGCAYCGTAPQDNYFGSSGSRASRHCRRTVR